MVLKVNAFGDPRLTLVNREVVVLHGQRQHRKRSRIYLSALSFLTAPPFPPPLRRLHGQQYLSDDLFSLGRIHIATLIHALRVCVALASTVIQTSANRAILSNLVAGLADATNQQTRC